MREAATGYVLLGVLAVGGAMSGFEIRRFIDNSVRFFWRESYGQIYPELKRLAAEGLIRPVGAHREGRDAKPWRITAAGRAALKAWLDKPAQQQPPRDETLLKLFFSRHAGEETRPALVAAARASALDRQRALKAAEQVVLREPDDPDLLASLLVLDRGLRTAEATLAWCEEAEKLSDAWAKGGAGELIKRWRRRP